MTPSTNVEATTPTAPPVPATKPTRRLFVGFLVVATLALSVLVTLLAAQNRRLKAMLDGAVPTLPASLSVGHVLPPIPVRDRAGAPSTLTFAGQAPATLVLVISGSCPHCENMIPVWRGQLDRAQNPRVRIVCLQADAPTLESLEELDQPWPLFGAVRDKKSWIRDVPMVPAAFLLDAHGTITHTWLGEMDDKHAEEFMFAVLGAGAGEPPAKSGG